MSSLDTTVPYSPPRRWLRVSKYLLPVGTNLPILRRTKSPDEQVRAAQLAADYPESVEVLSVGKAEVLPEFEYTCYASGERETRMLPTKFVAPAFVARLQDGMSFGRHCCVITAEGKAVRETGFNLDGEVLSERRPVSRWRPHYWRKRWEGDVTARPWLPAKQQIAGCVAVLNTRFSHNYYHWLIDVLPRVVPLRRTNAAVDYYLVDCLAPFQQQALAALGIEAHRLIQPHCRLLLVADELLAPSLPTPSCLREFGRVLTAGLGADRAAASTRRVFISRRKTGTRTLANEAELELLLGDHGFETRAMEDYSLGEQAQLIRESETIVATHGAGLANLVFARPGTRVIEIVPAGRYNATIYPEKSRIFGLHHQLIFAERARHKQVLTVSLDDVASALSQAERTTSRAAAA